LLRITNSCAVFFDVRFSVSVSVAGSPEILVSARSPEGFSLLRLARLTGFRTTIAPSLDEIGSVNMRATTWPLELAPRRRATSVG